jgi:hydroxyquinol 1,2-dioxygenase
VTARGFERVITHTFVAGDAYLTSDAVFGVKQSLITTFLPTQSQSEAWVADYDFVLTKAS